MSIKLLNPLDKSFDIIHHAIEDNNFRNKIDGVSCIHRPVHVLCSFGKDSSVLLNLLEPFIKSNEVRIIYIDSCKEMPSMKEHIDNYIASKNNSDDDFVDTRVSISFLKEHEANSYVFDGVDMITLYNREYAESEEFNTDDIQTFINKSRIDVLNAYLRVVEPNYIITGIRRDEEATRAKERYYSYRDKNNKYNPTDNMPEFSPLEHVSCCMFAKMLDGTSHIRVNALLDWTELDTWEYIRDCGINVCPLYFAQEIDGKMMRYRSLGDADTTTPVPSKATSVDDIIEELKTTTIPERASRASQDNAAPHMMETVRRDGFF